jgi:hypothetical protein
VSIGCTLVLLRNGLKESRLHLQETVPSGYPIPRVAFAAVRGMIAAIVPGST